MEEKESQQFKENITGKSEVAGSVEGLEDKVINLSQELKVELEDAREKYLRLYAEFENYKKKTQKDKEELLKYSNESLICDLLPVIDTLEMAVKHSSEGGAEMVQPLIKGVENTLREFNRVLEKSGLKAIDAAGKHFDPAYHHAMTKVETAEFENNVVIEEFRKGYILNNKVIRPALVSVSASKKT